MLRTMCKTKIDGGIITDKNLRYSGSIGIDEKIITASGLLEFEIVQVLNLNNGARFETYVIKEKAGSGKIALYGPAARMGEIGDPVIILSQGLYEEKESKGMKMKLVKLRDKNRTANEK